MRMMRPLGMKALWCKLWDMLDTRMYAMCYPTHGKDPSRLGRAIYRVWLRGVELITPGDY